MKIKFIDINDQILENVEVKFIVNDKPVNFVTDSEGIVEFFDAWDENKVTCYIHEEDKHDFTFKEGEIAEIKTAAPLVDMIFVTTNEKEESVIGAKVCFEYLNEQVELTSDNTGQIVLEKIPVNTDVKVYQLDKDKEVNVEINKCKQDKAQYFIKVDETFDISEMKFKLVDKSGQIIRSADVRFKVAGDEFESVTDQDGCITIKDIKVDSVVECKQMIFGKSLPWHKFKCETNIDIYILHGEKPQTFDSSNEKYNSQVRMKFRLVNSKGHPIPNAVIQLEIGERTRNKYTNADGEAMVDDVLIGDKVSVFVDVRGIQTRSEFVCQEDGEMHQVVLKTSNPKAYLWAIPVVLLIIIGIVYTQFDFSGSENEEETHNETIEKDTVIINNYYFKIRDSKEDKPLANSSINLIYKDTTFEKRTDIDGLAEFKAIAGKLPTQIDVNHIGYISNKMNFILDSVFQIKLSKNDSVLIADEILTCDNWTEAKGKKITYQSFKMNIPKGKFKLWLNFFNSPDMVDVFTGPIKDISDSKKIYSTEKYQKGIINQPINYDSKDSLITIKVSSGTADVTWGYKVYCGRPTIPGN